MSHPDNGYLCGGGFTSPGLDWPSLQIQALDRSNVADSYVRESLTLMFDTGTRVCCCLTSPPPPPTPPKGKFFFCDRPTKGSFVIHLFTLCKRSSHRNRTIPLTKKCPNLETFSCESSRMDSCSQQLRILRKLKIWSDVLFRNEIRECENDGLLGHCFSVPVFSTRSYRCHFSWSQTVTTCLSEKLVGHSVRVTPSKRFSGSFSCVRIQDRDVSQPTSHAYEGDPQSPVRPFVISKQFSKIEQK